MKDRELADLAQRHKAYLEASQPIICALSRLLAAYPSPRFIVTLGETVGKPLATTQVLDFEYPADVQRAIDSTREQLEAMRRSYGL